MALAVYQLLLANWRAEIRNSPTRRCWT